MHTVDAARELNDQVEGIINRWMLATGHRYTMAHRSLAAVQLARFLAVGHTEAELTAVRRRLGRPMPLHQLLVLDVEKRPSRFTRELSETGPQWFRPEVIPAPEPAPVRGTPDQEVASRRRASALLRATKEWVARGCVGPEPKMEAQL